MAEAEVPEEQYDAQFLGFSPSMLVEGVERVMAQRLEEALGQLEAYFCKVPEEVLPAQEREKGMIKLRQETDASFAKVQRKLEPYLLNVLKVPEHVLHPVDAEQATPVSPEQLATLRQEVERLRQDVLSEKYMKASFTAELADIEEVLQEQRKVLSMLDTTLKNGVEDFKEKLVFFQENQDDLLQGTRELRQVTQRQVKEASLSPGQVLAQQTFQ